MHHTRINQIDNCRPLVLKIYYNHGVLIELRNCFALMWPYFLVIEHVIYTGNTKDRRITRAG